MTDRGQYERLEHIPYHLGIGVATITFNCTLIGSSVDPEVTIFTPASTSADSNNPVIHPRG